MVIMLRRFLNFGIGLPTSPQVGGLLENIYLNG